MAEQIVAGAPQRRGGWALSDPEVAVLGVHG
jgi:hypothetical protein